MKAAVVVDYRDKRRAAYPPLEEQLDALWKALARAPLSAEGAAMRERIRAVKAQYPKPEGDGS